MKNKSLILIVIGLFLALCCCITALAGVGVYVVSDGNEESEDVVSSEEDNTPDAPSILDVRDAYEEYESYKFKGTVYFGEDMETISGKFISPDKEYHKAITDSGITEEIAIDGVYYVRFDEGNWQINTDTPYHSMIQYQEINTLLDEVDTEYVPEYENDEWVFEYDNEEYGEIWRLTVDADTSLPVTMSMEYTNSEGQVVKDFVEFYDFGEGMEIEAPITNEV